MKLLKKFLALLIVYQTCIVSSSLISMASNTKEPAVRIKQPTTQCSAQQFIMQPDVFWERATQVAPIFWEWTTQTTPSLIENGDVEKNNENLFNIYKEKFLNTTSFGNYLTAIGIKKANDRILLIPAFNIMLLNKQKDIMLLKKQKKEVDQKFAKAMKLADAGSQCLMNGDKKTTNYYFKKAGSLIGCNIPFLYKAIEVELVKLAESGDLAVQKLLASIYRTGFGEIKKDTYKAIQWTLFAKAQKIRAEQKSDDALDEYESSDDEDENDDPLEFRPITITPITIVVHLS